MPAAGGAPVWEQAFTWKNAALPQAPTWAPNSRRVAFPARTGFVVLDLPSRRVRTVPGESPGPLIWTQEAVLFSPDARTIVYADFDGLRLYAVSVLNGKTSLLWHEGHDGSYLGDFYFSPDSTKIAYEQDKRRGSNDAIVSDIYVVSARGGVPVRLTDDHKSYGPVWLKRGIAFIRSTGQFGGEVWLSDESTLHARRVTHSVPAAQLYPFSADGKTLFGFGGPTELFSVDVTSGVVHHLRGWNDWFSPLGISSDGSTIVAANNCDPSEKARVNIQTLPATGGHLHSVARAQCGVSWSEGSTPRR